MELARHLPGRPLAGSGPAMHSSASTVGAASRRLKALSGNLELHMATCQVPVCSCANAEHDFHNESKMAAACLQTAAMPHPLRPETDRSSYINPPPTWQPHAFRQLPPGLRKPSKEHFLIFHRYSTELFRGWACLLDFCKLLANMGLWRLVNVSAFGKPDAS